MLSPSAMQPRTGCSIVTTPRSGRFSSVTVAPRSTLAGDGFLTMFDGAARSVRAAIDMRAAVQAIGLEIRAGIHTGEVEVVPGGIRGLAVHETARIMALGAGGDILVSSTTRELSAGSGFSYQDRGVHQLKGIASPRHVFALVTTDDTIEH